MSGGRRRFLRNALGAIAAASVPIRGVAAPAFPTQPVRIIVPTTPSTGMDISVRVIGRQLEPVWGQPVVVLNVVGAGGGIGADMVAKARPDGHTLVLAHEGIMAITPLLQKAVRPRSDLRAVAPLTETDLVLIVNRASGIHTITEFMAEARKRAVKMTYGSPGNGTPSHLRMEILLERAGVELVHVPYKGGSSALSDVIGGHVDCALVGIAPALPHAGDKINVLAVSGANRNPLLPAIPTVAETFPGLSFTTWFGLFTAAETPRELIEIVSHAVTEAARAPAVVRPLQDQGLRAVGGTPEQLEAIVQNDFEMYAKLFKSGRLGTT